MTYTRNHVRSSIVAIVALAAMSIGTLDAMVASATATSVACARPDVFANAFREWVVRKASGGDSTAAERADLGIPALSDTAVVFLSDAKLCDTAARRHAAEVGQDTLTPPPVYLLRLGSFRYVVFNGAPAGEFSRYLVFDQAFVYTFTYGM